jgi:hypothetical protein
VEATAIVFSVDEVEGSILSVAPNDAGATSSSLRWLRSVPVVPYGGVKRIRFEDFKGGSCPILSPEPRARLNEARPTNVELTRLYNPNPMAQVDGSSKHGHPMFRFSIRPDAVRDSCAHRRRRRGSKNPRGQRFRGDSTHVGLVRKPYLNHRNKRMVRVWRR